LATRPRENKPGWPSYKGAVKRLRLQETPTEHGLWQHLRNRQLHGLKFRRQHWVGRFIVDFYCAEHSLVVEVDGPVHKQQMTEDRERQQYLEDAGYVVLRLTTEDVEADLSGVLRRIAEACASTAVVSTRDAPRENQR